jgi:hypothetical protein
VQLPPGQAHDLPLPQDIEKRYPVTIDKPQKGKLMKQIGKLVALCATLAWGAGLAIAAPPVQTDAGREYTVQPGDCLAKIAERTVGSQRFWPAIWQATNVRAMADSRFTLISDPDLIHSRQIVWLPTAAEAEAMLPQASFGQSRSAGSATAGWLAVDIVYYGQWYRDTFHYSKEAPNIRHLAVIMPEAQYENNPHVPGQICSHLSFPVDDEPLQFRSGEAEANWDVSVLHPVPSQVELEPGRYYVGGCFIAAPLSRQEAGAGDDAILYAGITGGGASSDYQVVTIQAGERKDITIALTDQDGWACPWVYVFNGSTFERRSEILRNLRSKDLEMTQRHRLGPVAVQDGSVRLQIREEKPETAYLDALFLEVGGIPVWPDATSAGAGLLSAVDGHYLVLQQGDVYELTFDVAALAGDNSSVEAAIVSTGYYEVAAR